MDALRERFGKYHVLEKIAQGGMAEIYKVKTIGIAGFEKVQALKRILPSSAREGRFIRSFIDEARIAVELTHRNIVQVFDFGKADGELYLAMELIEGKDLRTAVAQAVAVDRMCPIAVAAYIIAEVAAGLDYAHRKTDGYGGALGIVHCDVSPSNVMLSNDGYVKILDFGIARASFASALERKRLRGKPRYMAPEQTYGEPPTPASDVFALAIIGWELLTGLPLYRGHDLKSILQAVRRSEPPRVEEMNARVPSELCDAIGRALAREPSSRGTAGELAAACARTAMMASARDLASWLHDIEAPPSYAEQARPKRAPTPTPVAVELHIGEGTPGDGDDDEIILLVPKQKAVVAVPIAPIDDATGRITYAVDPSLEAIVVPRRAAVGATARFDPRTTPSTTTSAWSSPRRRSSAGAPSSSPPDRCGDAPALAASLGELAYQRGGVVVDRSSDGVVIAFGLEVAGEHAAAVAVAWALDAAAIARDAGAALRIGARANVATSFVERRAAGPRRCDRGGARARARRQPERPLLVGTTGRLTGRLYELRELAAPRRVGRRSKVTEIIGARPFEERDRARLERRGALIGRDGQLGELDALFAEAVASTGRRVAVIEGGAGTGKSRLVAELVARHGDARVVIAAATPASRLAPFALVGDVYQSALGFPPVRGRQARTRLVERVHHMMATSGLAAERARMIAADLDRAMELRDGAAISLSSLASSPGPTRVRLTTEPGLSPAAAEIADLRPRVAAGLAAFRAAGTERQGPGQVRALILVIEDIHLADAPSLYVLRHLIAVPASCPELVIMTGRPDAAAPVDWSATGDARLALGDLAGDELRALVADRLGDAATPTAIDAVIAQAGGNPMFIEELAHAVREAGGRGGDVPATARDVALARVDRLAPRAKAALRYAAVLGAEIRTRLLEELVDLHPAPPDGGGARPGRAGTIEGGELGDAVDELVDAGMLERGDADTVAFHRGLLREVVYEAMPPRACRDAHRQIGRLLASRFFAGRDEVPAVIAEHLERGGEPAGAAAFWLRAGRAALAARDGAAATTCFQKCLTVERELGAEPATRTSRARRAAATAGEAEARALAVVR